MAECPYCGKEVDNEEICPRCRECSVCCSCEK